MSFIFSESAGLNNAKIGKLLNPLKMIIENESDYQKKQGGALDWLFNIEKSGRYGETVQYQDDFASFKASTEGNAAEGDFVVETRSKFIEHIPFKKEFVITKEMLDDSVIGIAPDAKRRAENFTRAYYKTMNEIAQRSIINGVSLSMSYNGATVDLSCADGKALFAKDHLYGSENSHTSGVQSNHFYVERDADEKLSVKTVEDMLSAGVSKIRLMKDENGDPLGYVADTVIIPGNLPAFERYVKQVLGSEHEASSSSNGVNIHYGNFSLVILPEWQVDEADTYPMIVMSSEANKNLAGNLFFNRVPLDIKSWEDGHTRNWIFNGYCRFGIGFGSYKHICKITSVGSGKSVAGADKTSI